MLTCPTPHKGGKIPSVLSSEVLPSFWQPLIKQEGRCFHFLFPDPLFAFLFPSVLTNSLISPSQSKVFAFGLTAFSLNQLLFLPDDRSSCLTGRLGCTPSPRTGTGQNNSSDHDYINRWQWKYTCRGSFYLQTLLSLLSNSRSQSKWFSHHGILHTSFYPNTKSDIVYTINSNTSPS